MHACIKQASPCLGAILESLTSSMACALAAYQQAKKLFLDNQKTGYRPHLSLLYGDFSVETKKEIIKKYLLYGKAKQAVDMEFARFQANLDHTTYRSVRSAALATGQPGDLWPGLRSQLIQTLERQGRWGALVSLYLDEKEVGQALAALAEMERTPGAPFYGGYRFESPSSSYQAKVAEAAEEAYPEEALRLYKPVVQRLIDGHGRENYQQATCKETILRQ